jgi:hypothetical protein
MLFGYYIAGRAKYRREWQASRRAVTTGKGRSLSFLPLIFFLHTFSLFMGSYHLPPPPQSYVIDFP